jgi:hypothetical protein
LVPEAGRIVWEYLGKKKGFALSAVWLLVQVINVMQKNAAISILGVFII